MQPVLAFQNPACCNTPSIDSSLLPFIIVLFALSPVLRNLLSRLSFRRPSYYPLSPSLPFSTILPFGSRPRLRCPEPPVAIPPTLRLIPAVKPARAQAPR